MTKFIRIIGMCALAAACLAGIAFASDGESSYGGNKCSCPRCFNEHTIQSECVDGEVYHPDQEWRRRQDGYGRRSAGSRACIRCGTYHYCEQPHLDRSPDKKDTPDKRDDRDWSGDPHEGRTYPHGRRGFGGGHDPSLNEGGGHMAHLVSMSPPRHEDLYGRGGRKSDGDSAIPCLLGGCRARELILDRREKGGKNRTKPLHAPEPADERRLDCRRSGPIQDCRG